MSNSAGSIILSKRGLLWFVPNVHELSNAWRYWCLKEVNDLISGCQQPSLNWATVRVSTQGISIICTLPARQTNVDWPTDVAQQRLVSTSPPGPRASPVCETTTPKYQTVDSMILNNTHSQCCQLLLPVYMRKRCYLPKQNAEIFMPSESCLGTESSEHKIEEIDSTRLQCSTSCIELPAI